MDIKSGGTEEHNQQSPYLIIIPRHKRFLHTAGTRMVTQPQTKGSDKHISKHITLNIALAASHAVMYYTLNHTEIHSLNENILST